MHKNIILTLLFSFFLKAEEANHIIFSRIAITPDQAEMVAIYNPTNDVIDLTDFDLKL